MPPRQARPHDPWPRWGWFPRAARTWAFAPSPDLAAPDVAVPESAASASGPLRPPAPQPTAQPQREPEPWSAPRGEGTRASLPPETGAREEVARAELLPVRRSPSVALVPVRTGEVTLSDVARAVRKAAPAAAVVGAAAAAAMALFRRR